MKVNIKCYEFLTNKGNGSKCFLGPLCNKLLRDCVFKKNGMDGSCGIKEKKVYISSLALTCKQWHDRKNETAHFFSKIHPQLEKIYENLEKKESIKE